MMSVDDFEAIEETLFWQSQPGVEADVRVGRAEADAGTLSDEAAIRRRYGVGSAR
jgi:PHD/YefM family antitoxin component YafN of YafNO toxin-antitoxin module